MKDSKTYVKTRFFEIGKTSTHDMPNEDFMVFYKKKLSEWSYVIGVKFKKVGYYII